MKFFKTKKIPTIIGLTVIIVGLSVSVFLVHRSQHLFLSAKASLAPGQVKITNISDGSFTVSWFTAQPTSGYIQYSQNPDLLNLKATSDYNGNQYSHYVTLNNLEPASTYYFQIHSGTQKYQDNGKPYQQATATKKMRPSTSNDLAYGIILNNDGTPAEGAIVYLNMANSSLQSSLVSSSGNWAVPLNLARTNDLEQFVNYDPDASTIEIFVQSLDQTASAITTTGNDNPVPTISLGENLDFRQIKSEASAQKTDTNLASGFLPEQFPFELSSVSLSIINPANGETVATQKPEFFGKGPTNQEIKIEVESSLFTDQVPTNEWGDWFWSPPQDLEPGEHKITISYTDNDGQTQSIFHNFIVLAASEVGDSDLPSFTATPSATPTGETPSPDKAATPTPTGTPVPDETPTATPTTALETTPTLTQTPTSTPTPVPEASPAPTASPPGAPGTLTPTLLIFIIGLLMVTSGVLLPI